MSGHLDSNGRRLPILPRARPGTPRKQARFSVVDPKKEDKFNKRKIMNDDGEKSTEYGNNRVAGK